MRAALQVVLLVFVAATTAFGQQTQRTSPSQSPVDNSADEARTILQRYVEAWRGAEEMVLSETVVLGFEVDGTGGGAYHVTLPPSGGAELADGVPDSGYDVVFTTDIDLLRRLDRGELNALTALGRARMSDPTPLDFRFPPGFQLTPEAQSHLLRLTFHFWNRDWPEIIAFGDGLTRNVHGANSALFYYQRGIRTGWYQVEPGMHINRAEAEQTNPFPSLFIMTRGRVQARLGGELLELEEGQAVLVPAGMAHEFWAEEGQYGEFVLVMFGEGA
jgi:mannose-6-phosphate isomerase-like protein (cupin superfamily)